MTKKQLENIIVLACMYEDNRFSVEEINKKFGLSITEQTSRQEVVSDFLKINNITLYEETANIVMSNDSGEFKAQIGHSLRGCRIKGSRPDRVFLEIKKEFNLYGFCEFVKYLSEVVIPVMDYKVDSSEYECSQPDVNRHFGKHGTYLKCTVCKKCSNQNHR